MAHFEGGKVDNDRITFGDTNVIDNIFILPYSDIDPNTEISGESYIKNRWISRSINIDYTHADNTGVWNKTVYLSAITDRILRYMNGADNDTIFGLTQEGSAINMMLGGRKIGFLAAAPTAGGWGQGSIVYNNAVLASSSAGWMCTESGTFGTASETDGITTVSSASIIMADTSSFEIYDWVDVDKGFPTTGPYRIIHKTATSITLDTDSDSAETGVTVDTSDPTFKELANVGA